MRMHRMKFMYCDKAIKSKGYSILKMIQLFNKQKIRIVSKDSISIYNFNMIVFGIML